ncbi:hypothetical protein AB1M95_10670 [Sulfitobacter sp. LCG007]
MKRGQAGRRAILGGIGALVLLAGCARTPPAREGYRDTTVPIGGTVRFDPKRFEGDWQVVAHMPDASAHPRNFSYDILGGMTESGEGPARRYRLREGSVLQEVATDVDTRLVVMWVDDDFRTAALGTVDGRRGTIFDRVPGGSADRTQAAVEVMQFYGWDVSQLIGVAK